MCLFFEDIPRAGNIDAKETSSFFDDLVALAEEELTSRGLLTFF